MNKLKLAIIAVVVMMATVNFTENETKNKAIANREGDFYVFHLAIPANDYNVIGEIKLPGIVRDASPRGLYTNLVNRAKKTGIKFDGLIIAEDMATAEMVVFK